MLKKEENLYILYAENRIKFKEISDKIWHLQNPSNEFDEKLNKNMQRYRINYYKDTSYMGRYNQWRGWRHCLTYYKNCTPNEIQLAKLWDEKNKLKKELAAIKRRIYWRGRREGTGQC